MEEESVPTAARIQRLCRLCLEWDVQMLLVRRQSGVAFPQKISKKIEKVMRGLVETYLGRNKGPPEQ